MSGKKKQHKHKLFGPDFPRTFLTLTPGCPGVKNFLPTTGDFWCGRPRFSARTSMTEGLPKNFVQKKFALIFWPHIVGVWNGWGYGIAIFRALNLQISEPEIWKKSPFRRSAKFPGFSWKFRPLKNIFRTLENGHSIRHQSIPPLSAGRLLDQWWTFQMFFYFFFLVDVSDILFCLTPHWVGHF